LEELQSATRNTAFEIPHSIKMLFLLFGVDVVNPNNPL
jgi:hypothetical protein